MATRIVLRCRRQLLILVPCLVVVAAITVAAAVDLATAPMDGDRLRTGMAVAGFGVLTLAGLGQLRTRLIVTDRYVEIVSLIRRRRIAWQAVDAVTLKRGSGSWEVEIWSGGRPYEVAALRCPSWLNASDVDPALLLAWPAGSTARRYATAPAAVPASLRRPYQALHDAWRRHR